MVDMVVLRSDLGQHGNGALRDARRWLLDAAAALEPCEAGVAGAPAIGKAIAAEAKAHATRAQTALGYSLAMFGELLGLGDEVVVDERQAEMFDADGNPVVAAADASTTGTEAETATAAGETTTADDAADGETDPPAKKKRARKGKPATD